MNRAKKCKVQILIVLTLTVLLELAMLTFKYTYRAWGADHVTDINISQDDSELVFSWNEITSGEYRIEVSRDGEIVAEADVSENSYTVEDIDFLADYQATVYGKNEDGDYVRGATDSIFSREPQEIETELDRIDAFPGKDIELDAQAAEELTYSTSDDNIASVDESGNVHLISAGKAEITIDAGGSETTLPEQRTIEVVCYPDKLDAPGLKLVKDDGVSVVLELKKVDYAGSYELIRVNPRTEEEEIFTTIDEEEFEDADTMEMEMAAEIGKYSLRAVAEVEDERLVSESSETVEVESGLDDAAAYSSLTNIITIGSDDVDKIARSTGSGGASVAQSICCTGDGYVVALVNRGNSAGALDKFDREGNLIATNSGTGRMGHANGCTYDENTGKIYVMQTYAGHKNHAIRVFDGETLESLNNISFGTAPSGIGYDSQMDHFYLTASSRIYITDGSLNMIRTIYRKRIKNSQDVCGYNGIVMSCIWTGGSSSYIDMYRASNGSYLGSIYVPLGEIEGACVDDGYLVMVFNGGSIYRTKERVAFPG